MVRGGISRGVQIKGKGREWVVEGESGGENLHHVEEMRVGICFVTSLPQNISKERITYRLAHLLKKDMVEASKRISRILAVFSKYFFGTHLQ